MENKIKNYYIIPAWIVRLGGVMVLLLIVFKVMILSISLEQKNEFYRTEWGSLETKIQNDNECYLCGQNNRNLMGYYRKFDTIGVIGLNEWYILDLRLKSYDEQGNETEPSRGTNSVFGNSQGVNYYLNAIPSRGKSNARVSADDEFNPELIQNHLCQECLDKVTQTLSTYQVKGRKVEYTPFILVDFETLELYSMQNEYVGYFIRDYWVEVNHEEEIEIDAYYLPEK